MATTMSLTRCGCGNVTATGAGGVWRWSFHAMNWRVEEAVGRSGRRNGIIQSNFGGLTSSLGNGKILGLGERGMSWARANAEKASLGDGGGDRGGGIAGRGGGGGGGGGGPGDGLNGGSGDEASLTFGAGLWIWYNGLLESRPLVAKSITAGLLNAIADIFCQVVVEKLDKVDWKRVFSFVAIGLFLSGPGLHYWYGALPKIIKVPGLGGILLRIALDQLVFTPLGMVSFFVVLLTLEDRQQEIVGKLEKDWLPTVVANWKVWIPFQIVNFGMVPPHLQVPAAGLLGTLWSVFISYKGHT